MPSNGSLDIDEDTIDFFLKSSGLNIDTLFIPFFVSILHPRSFPNLRKTFAKVLSLNFLARVNAQDSVNSQIILDRLGALEVKL